MKSILLFSIFALFTSITIGQNIDGDWQGSLNISGTELPLIFHITTEESKLTATMDSPAQGAFGIPVDEISLYEKELTIKILPLSISYQGTLQENEIFIGDFEQGGHQFPLKLERKYRLE